MSRAYDESLNWINDKKRTIAGAIYGRNHHNLQTGLAEQEALAREVTEYQRQVDRALSLTFDADKKKLLEEAYSELQASSDKKRKCLQTMFEIANLEENCTRLSRVMDETSVSLTGSREKTEAPLAATGESLSGFISPGAKDCVFAVKDNWDWVVKLVKCIDIHLKNGSDYHQYFHEIDESAPWMLNDIEEVKKRFEKLPLDGNSDSQRLMTELEEVAIVLRLWESKTDRLWEKATKVLPIHLRTEGVTQPTPARALVDYTTPEISIREGEDILLLDNSDPESWRIRNGDGQTGQVPPLAVIIPGPYKDAVDAAVRLRLQLLASWTDAVKTLGKRLICYMLLMLKPDYSSHEIDTIRAIPQLRKADLVRILDRVEDTMKTHWADHEGFINLQERLLALRMILEEVEDGEIRDENLYKTLVSQVTGLEDLMKKYKDLWGNWEMYKTTLEASQNPELMLIVDKWSQLQFVTRDFLSNFWKNELPLDTMERSLMTLKNMTLEGDKLDAVQVPPPSPQPGTSDSGWEETRTTYVTERELNRAKKVDLQDALVPMPDQTTQDEGFEETRVVEKQVTTELLERPVHRSKMVNLTDALGTDVETTDSGWDETRVVETQHTVTAEKPLHRSKMGQVDISQALGGMTETTDAIPAVNDDAESRESGFDESRTKTTTVRLHTDARPAVNDDVGSHESGFDESRTKTTTMRLHTDARPAVNDDAGSHESGFDESRVKTTTMRLHTVPLSNGSIHEGDEVFDEGLTEEGVVEHIGNSYHGSRAHSSETEGSTFGFATETRTAETEQVDSAEVEEQKKFIIRAVVNTSDDSEISLQEAIMRGIIIPMDGTYVDFRKGESVPIPTAMSSGLIKVEFTSTRRGQEKRSTMGIITIKTTREPVRPYVIDYVMDTSRNEKLNPQEAEKRHVLEQQQNGGGIFINQRTGDRMLVVEAAEQGLAGITYSGDVPEPEIVAKTYAVRAVVDRRLKKVITFTEAVRRGIIDKESGAYKDTMTGESMYVGDAIMRGFLKARNIDRSHSLDVDPDNMMMVDKTEAIRKKVLQPLKVISAFKRAAGLPKSK